MWYWINRYTKVYSEGKYKGLRCNEDIFKELRQEAPHTLTVGHVMRDEEVDRAIGHPNVLIASDGILHRNQGHPRAAGTFPRLINEYVKKKKILTLYQAVEKMTYLPAKRFGINKGTLSLGADADITIFDYDLIKDKSSFREPILEPDGIKFVLLSGEIVLKDNVILNNSVGKFVSKS